MGLWGANNIKLGQGVTTCLLFGHVLRTAQRNPANPKCSMHWLRFGLASLSESRPICQGSSPAASGSLRPAEHQWNHLDFYRKGTPALIAHLKAGPFQ